jgi:hypothetical protein
MQTMKSENQYIVIFQRIRRRILAPRRFVEVIMHSHLPEGYQNSWHVIASSSPRASDKGPRRTGVQLQLPPLPAVFPVGLTSPICSAFRRVGDEAMRGQARVPAALSLRRESRTPRSAKDFPQSEWRTSQA